MNKSVICAALLVFAASGASANELRGNAALALAALVAQHAPVISPNDQKVLAALFDGNSKVALPSRAISITAESIVCRAGDVDITLHSCDLVFAKEIVTVGGRAGHELFATVAEAGVPSDGAAGSSYEALSQLVCTVNVPEVEQLSGGGAECKFNAGPS
jgi:hypothetical protein